MKKKSVSRQKFNDFKVEGNAAFYCCDGKVYYCLNDLSIALSSMPKATFAYHVNKEKNDFYNWIKDIYKAEDIANSIKACKTALTIKKKLDKFL